MKTRATCVSSPFDAGLRSILFFDANAKGKNKKTLKAATGKQNRAAAFTVSLFSVFVLFIGSLFPPSMLHANLFFWTDSQGVRHYSNVAPSASAEDVQILEESTKKYNTYSSEMKNRLTFRAVKIYDGDSMKVEGSDLVLMVRLVGIDAPESGRKGVPGQPFSRKSKDALIRMIGDRPFQIKSYGTGGYNRLLSEVFTEDGMNVNLEMVKLGLAEVYQGSPPNGFNRRPYQDAEASARSRRMGMWALGSRYQSPKQWRKAHSGK